MVQATVLESVLFKDPSATDLPTPSDIDALTDACEKLIKDLGLRQTLGETGQKSVIEKFAPNTMVDTIETVYNKLLEQKALAQEEHSG